MMNIPLNDPKLVRYVEDQVREGAFSSASEVIEAAIARLMLDEDQQTDALDADTLRAIRQAESQIARGEAVDVRDVAVAMRRQYGAG